MPLNASPVLGFIIQIYHLRLGSAGKTLCRLKLLVPRTVDVMPGCAVTHANALCESASQSAATLRSASSALQ